MQGLGAMAMKRSIALCCVAVILSADCTKPAYGQGQTLNRTISHGGLQRLYTLYVPSSYRPGESLPLVVNMHGITLNRQFQMTRSGMNTVAEREGFVVAYPDAVNADWFGPQDNIGFIDSLLGDVSSQYSINQSRVYATGFSQGGIMSYVLSVERPYTFAAVASVGGTRYFDSPNVPYPRTVAETPARPFPLLHIHGTNDSVVPYNGGVGAFDLVFPPVANVVESYVASNGGDLAAAITDLPNINTADGSSVRLFFYGGGNYFDLSGNPHEAEVLLYRIQNGGHNWPGNSTGWTESWAPPVNYDISASNEIWTFFSRHQVAAIPEPSTVCLAALGLLAFTVRCCFAIRLRKRTNAANNQISNATETAAN